MGMPDDEDKKRGLGPSKIPDGWTPPGRVVLDPSGFKPATLDPEVVRRETERLEREKRQRLIDIAYRTPVHVSVRLNSLTGTGSDVDEIYGALRVSVKSSFGIDGIVQRPPEWAGRGSFQILDITGSVDLSDGRRYPAQGRTMPAATFSIDYPNSAHCVLTLWSTLMDEDDGRDHGAGNDEVFYFKVVNRVMKTSTQVLLNIPDCEDQPDFKRESRRQFTMKSGDRGTNKLFIVVHTRWWRDATSRLPQ
jgi:hypothetical protein